MLSSALLDRLLHHADTVRIEGKSYRMKDQIEAWARRSSTRPHSSSSLILLPHDHSIDNFKPAKLREDRAGR